MVEFAGCENDFSDRHKPSVLCVCLCGYCTIWKPCFQIWLWVAKIMIAKAVREMMLVIFFIVFDYLTYLNPIKNISRIKL
jgi:hypothetical protein